MKCPECGSVVDDLLTPDGIWTILSESSMLLKKYEEKELIIGEDMSKGVCWDCFWSAVEEFLADEIDFEEQVKIRKEYNETWAPEFEGTLHRIMNAAMVHACLGCGNKARGISYDQCNPQFKKISRKLLKEAGLTLKDTERVLCICNPCLQRVLEEYQEQKRAKLKPITKDQAHGLIREFLSNVGKINTNPHYNSQIAACAVVGSYLSGTEKIKDIDIALCNTWKNEPPAITEDDPVLKAFKTRSLLSQELNDLINGMPHSEHFHFHSWSLLWLGKLREQKENIPFNHEFLYVGPGYSKEQFQNVINNRVQQIVQNPEIIIID